MIEIFMTMHGPKLIDNENKIRVIRSMISGRYNLRDIVSDTGMSKSTVYSSLKTLMDDGIISTDGEGNDKIYIISASPMLHSCDQDITVDEAKILDIVGEHEKYNIPDIMIMLSILYASHRCGISMETVFSNTGRILAQVVIDNGYIKDIDGAIKFLNDTEFMDVKLMSRSPYTFDIDFFFDIQGDAFRTLSMLFARFLEGFMTDTTDEEYHISSFKRVGDRKAIIELGQKDMDGRSMLTHVSDVKIEDVTEKEFSVYNGNDGVVAITGKMKSVLDALDRNEASSIELAGILGLPQTTIIGYLNQLESMGLLRSRRSGNKSIYTSIAQNIFEWGDPIHADKDPFEPLKEAFRNPQYLLRYALVYIGLASHRLGFRLSSLLSSIGRSMAWTSIHSTETKNIDELFRIMSRTQFVPSLEFTILTYSPLTVIIRFNYKLDESVVEMLKVIINEYMSGLMEFSTDMRYNVKVSSYSGEGYDSFKSVFEPDYRNNSKVVRSI